MKKTLLLLLAMTCSLLAFSQETKPYKLLESNIQITGGLFSETGNCADEVYPGLVVRLSYGLDVRLNQKWSVMPGVATRTQQAEIDKLDWVGGDPDSMDLLDIFCQGRYHFNLGSVRMVAGLGPQLSYMTTMDTYYIDADPHDPLGGQDKFKEWSFSMMPSLSLLIGKHFLCGLEGCVGLSNLMKQYPQYDHTGTIFVHYCALTLGVRF